MLDDSNAIAAEFVCINSFTIKTFGRMVKKKKTDCKNVSSLNAAYI